MARMGAIDTGREPSCSAATAFIAVRMCRPFSVLAWRFFVAHGPHEDAGMIAIAADEIGELAQAFRIRRHHARLIEDQHAELVAGVEQLR